MGDDKPTTNNFVKVFKLKPDLTEELNQVKQKSLFNNSLSPTNLTKSSSLASFLIPFMNNKTHLSESTSDLDSDNDGLTISVKSNNTNEQIDNNNKTLDSSILNSHSIFKFESNNGNSGLKKNYSSNNFFFKNQENKEPFFKRLFKPDSNLINNKEFNVMAPSSH